MAKLAQLGGDIPDGEARVGVEDGINVPPLEAACYGHQWFVAGLPPCPHVLSPLLERPTQGVRCLLV